MRPTPLAGWLTGAGALTALVLPPSIAITIVAALLVMTAIDAWSVRNPPDVTRTAPHILSRGVPEALTITLGRRAFTTQVRQPARPDVEVVPAEADGGLDAEIVATRRGRHLLPAVATRSTGVLRLGRAFHRVGEDTELLVYPDMATAHRLAAAVRSGRFVQEGRRRRGPLGLGTDFESIRDYLPDDDIRQVNWRATERMGKPMSNQWRVEQDRDVIIVVDTGRLMGSPAGATGDRTRLDAAVDAAAAVALVADVLGDRAGLIAFDASIHRLVPPGRAGGDRVVRAVFDLEPSEAESDYHLAFSRVGGAKRSFVLVLTDLLDEAAAHNLLEATAVVGRRHSVTIAGVIDHDIDEAISTDPAGMDDVWRAVVAADVLDARARVSERLTHAGARVVEAPPESLSARCVGAYLRAKAGARV